MKVVLDVIMINSIILAFLDFNTGFFVIGYRIIGNKVFTGIFADNNSILITGYTISLDGGVVGTLN